jgi:hypothetical protein
VGQKLLDAVGQLPRGTCVGTERGINAGVKWTVGPRPCPIKGVWAASLVLSLPPHLSYWFLLCRTPPAISCISPITSPWIPRSPGPRSGSHKAPDLETFFPLSPTAKDKGLNSLLGMWRTRRTSEVRPSWPTPAKLLVVGRGMPGSSYASWWQGWFRRCRFFSMSCCPPTVWC